MTHIDNAIKLIIDYDYALESESIDSAIEIIIHRALIGKQRAAELEAHIKNLSSENTDLIAEVERLENVCEFYAREHEQQLTGAAETIVTLTAERDEEHQKGVTLAKWLATATKERDEARLELQHIRTMIDDGTGEENDTAFDMARRLHAQCYEQAKKLEALVKAYDAMRDTVMNLTL